MLTLERLKELMWYCPETGEFIRIRRQGKSLPGSIVGYIHNKTGYVIVGVDYEEYLAHRLAWFYMTGEWPKDEIDHRNRDRANNEWENLREAKPFEQRQNMKVRSGNLLGTGVYYDERRRRYKATISIRGKAIWLGYHETLSAAQSARRRGKLKHHKFGMSANAHKKAAKITVKKGPKSRHFKPLVI